MTDKNVVVESNTAPSQGKGKFEALAKEQEQKKKQDDLLKKKKEERQGGGGVTKIGNKKGTAKAFAAVFEAKERGDDAEIKETKGGWDYDPNKASGHDAVPGGTGKWTGGGPGGIKAEIKKKETPKSPPPPKDLKQLVKETDSGNTGK